MEATSLEAVEAVEAREGNLVVEEVRWVVEVEVEVVHSAAVVVAVEVRWAVVAGHPAPGEVA